jgi:SAM-dependent methyltransferase
MAVFFSKLCAIYRDNDFVVDTIVFMILNLHYIMLRLLFPQTRRDWLDKYFMIVDASWQRDLQLKASIFKPIHDLVDSIRQTRSEDKQIIKILEVGPGTGYNFRFYPPGVHVTTIDPSKILGKAASEAAEKHPDVTFHHVTGDACNMRMFKDESFDFVVATHVFCCIPDYHQAVREIHRVLKKVSSIKSWHTKKTCLCANYSNRMASSSRRRS